MKKGLRIIALLFAALMAASALSVAFAAASDKPIADGKTNDNTMFYQNPSTSSAYVKGYMLLHAGTSVFIYDFTDDASWAFVKFDVHEGWIETCDLNITLRKGISVPGLNADNKGVVVGPNTTTGTTTPTLTPSSTTSIGTAVTTADAINFRTGPGTSYAKVSGCKQLPKGATVTLISSQTTDQLWYKVKYGNYEGFLAGKYLKVTLTPQASAPTSSGSGIFGGTQPDTTNMWLPGETTKTTTGGGLFGNQPTNTTPTTNNNTNTTPSTGNSSSSGLFGGGMFGNNTDNNNTSSGSANTGYTSGGGLFGNQQTTQQQSSSQGTQSCTITASDVNMRSGAGTTYSKIDKLKKNTTGVVHSYVDKNSGWYEVTINGKRGYVSAKYVKVSGAVPTNTTTNTTTNNSGSLISNTQPTTTSGYAAYTGSSSDIWGSISVPNTHINASIYCNALDKKGAFVYNAYSAKYNYIYALNYVGSQISVIYGHNMRKAAKNNIFTPTSSNGGPGLHELHHIQNAWLGKAKCEHCGKSCADARTDVFNINYNGASRWQLVGFFELNSKTMSSSSTRKSVQKYASFPGANAADWAKTMMSYCTSKYNGATLGSFNSSDKMMVIITCGDSSGNNNQSLYMLLRAIG